MILKANCQSRHSAAYLLFRMYFYFMKYNFEFFIEIIQLNLTWVLNFLILSASSNHFSVEIICIITSCLSWWKIFCSELSTCNQNALTNFKLYIFLLAIKLNTEMNELVTKSCLQTWVFDTFRLNSNYIAVCINCVPHWARFEYNFWPVVNCR